MVWSHENVTFCATKEDAVRDANWLVANGVSEVILTETKIYRVFSTEPNAERTFQTPCILYFSRETAKNNKDV